ncbi:MAG: hypothetical protein ABSC11_12810 [Smithella sp.]|jgi:hypothetical protein
MITAPLIFVFVSVHIDGCWYPEEADEEDKDEEFPPPFPELLRGMLHAAKNAEVEINKKIIDLFIIN